MSNLIDEFEFECAKPNCSEKFKYKNAHQHFYEHEVKKYPCILNCSDSLFNPD